MPPSATGVLLRLRRAVVVFPLASILLTALALAQVAPQIVVQFDGMTYEAVEGGSSATVTVLLSEAPAREVAIDVQVAGQGGAVAADYSVSALPLTFAADQTEASLVVTALPDAEPESGEGVRLSLALLGLPEGMRPDLMLGVADVALGDAGVSLAVSPGTRAEGAGQGFSVDATWLDTANPPASDLEVTLDVGAPGSTAGAGDWVAPSPDPVPTLTITAGQTAGSVSLTLADDGVVEPDELLVVGGTAGGTGVSRATLTVTDDADTATLGVSNVPDASGTGTPEGGDAVFVVTLDTVEAEVSVPWTVVVDQPGGVSAGDAAVLSGTLTIPPSTSPTSSPVSVEITDDALFEGPETLAFRIGTPTIAADPALVPRIGFGATVATADIAPSDPVTLSLSGPSGFPENGIGGSQAAVYMIAVTGGDRTETIEVDVVVTSDDALPGDDYTAPSAPVTIPVSGNGSFPVAIVNDSDNDDGEVVTVSLSNPSSAGGGAIVLEGAPVETRIEDDDFPAVEVSFSPRQYRAEEGGEPAIVTVTLTAPPERPVSVSVRWTRGVSGRIAELVSDLPGSVAFEAGQTEATFPVAFGENPTGEEDRPVTLGFAPGLPQGFSAPSGGRAATVTLADNDTPSTLVVLTTDPATVNEGDGTVDLEVVASLNGSVPSTKNLEVPLEFSSNQEYVGYRLPDSLPALTIPVGELAGSVTVPLTLVEDTDTEPEKVILLDALLSPERARHALITVVDNDDVVIDIVGPQALVSEDLGIADFTVTISSVPERQLIVTLDVIDGTATEGETDFFGRGSKSTVVFGGGRTFTEAPFRIQVFNDRVSEPDETFTVSVASFDQVSHDRVSIAADASAVATIAANDPLDMSISGPSEVDEGEETGVYAVAIVGDETVPDGDLTVAVSVSGDVTAGEDFVQPDPVTIASGSNDAELTIRTLDDTVDDDSERMVVSLGDVLQGGGAVTGGPGALSVTTVINDNDDPEVTASFGQAMHTAREGVPIQVTVRLNAPPERELSVPVTLVAATVASPSDYEFDDSVAFIPSSSVGTFRVEALDDAVFEPSAESIVLGFDLSGLDRVSAGPIAAATVTLEDNDDPDGRFIALSYDLSPQVPHPTTSLHEHIGRATITIGARLAGSVPPAQPLPVTLGIDPDGSSAGYEDTALPVLTIPAGELAASEVVTISLVNNSAVDPTRALVITGSATGFTLNEVSIPVTDEDNALVGLGPGSTFREGDTGTMLVTLSRSVDADIEVPWDITPSVQLKRNDLSVSAGTVTFAANADSAARTVTVEFPIIDDDEFEDTEFADFTLGDITVSDPELVPRVELRRQRPAIGILIDGADAPTVFMTGPPPVEYTLGDGSVTSYIEVQEGDAVPLRAELRDAITSTDASVRLTYNPPGREDLNHATAEDYEAVDPVVIPAGETMRDFAVLALQDDEDDAGEIIEVVIRTVVGGSTSDRDSAFVDAAQATVTVTVIETNTHAFYTESTVTVFALENTPPGLQAGQQVTASDFNDPSPFDLHYRVADDPLDAGEDSDSFTTGEQFPRLTVAAGATLDYETKDLYTVTMEAGDFKDDRGIADTAYDDSIVVVVSLIDVSMPEPDFVSVSGAADGELFVEWDPPVTAIPVDSYDGRYRAAGTEEYQVFATATTGTTATITGLERDAEYEVEVRANGGEGVSEWTVGRGTTTPNRPPEFDSTVPMLSVIETLPGGTQVGVPDPATDPDGDTVSHALEGDAPLAFGIDPGSAQLSVAPGATLDFESREEHRVTVVATDGLGGRAERVMTISISDLPEPPLAPSPPALSLPPAGGRNTLVAEWTPPDNTGRPTITGYEVQYRALGAAVFETVSVGTPTATISGLDSDTVHEAQVRATNDEGTGPWSGLAQGRTDTGFVVEMASATASGDEGDTVALGITVEEAAPSDLTVTYSLSDVRGATGDDYADQGGGTVTILSGASAAGIEVSLTDDDLPETSEVFAVRLEGAGFPGEPDRRARLGDLAGTSVTIGASDAVVVTLTGPPSRDVPEGGEIVLTLSITGEDNLSPVTVEIGPGDDETATPTVDYTAPTVAVIPPGGGSTVITVEAVPDSDDDAGDIIVLTLTNPTGDDDNILVETTPVTATIIEPNAPPGFDMPTVTITVPENPVGGFPVGPPVAADDPDPDTTLTYTLGDDDDPASPPAATLFGIDEDSGQVTVRPGADLDHESMPTLTVVVTVGDGKDDRGFPDPSADDEVTVVVVVSDVDEPPANPVTLTAAPVALDPHLTLSVEWEAPDPGGGPPIDDYDVEFRPSGGAEEFAAVTHDGTGTSAVIAGLSPDTLYDVRARPNNSEGSGPWSPPFSARTAVAHTVTMRSRTVLVSEDFTALVSVALDPPNPDNAVVVGYGVNDVSADAGTDYTAPSGSLTIPAGGAEGVIMVPITDDTAPEASEVFAVTLTSAMLEGTPDNRVVLGGETETSVTIAVSDAVALSLGADPLAEPGETATATVTALGAFLSADAMVSVSVAGAAGDFTPPAADLAVPAAAMSALIEVLVAAAAPIGNEITVSIHMPTGGTPGYPLVLDASSVTLTVADPNLPPGFGYPGGVTTLTVAENTSPGAPVGAAVTATDPDSDATLTYSLSGRDSALFAVDPDSGQLSVGAAATLDHEAAAERRVTVEVSDGKDDIGRADPSADATVAVVVEVTDEDEWPGPPTGLAAEPPSFAGHVSLVVTWAAPDTAGIPPVTGYDIEHRETGQPDAAYTAAQVEHMGADLVATVSGLSPATGHDVRVRARNDEDTALDGTVRSPWATVAASTGANLAPEFPVDSVTFSIPESAVAGDSVGTPQAADPVDGDAVSYSLVGGDSGSFTLDASGQVSVGPAAAPDHESAPTLSMTLRATDAFDATADLPVTVLVTDVDEPPGAPTGLSVEPDGQTALTVSWIAPPASGIPPVTGYDVEYRRGGDTAYTTANLAHSGLDTAAAISGLEPGTGYEVRVRARNDEDTDLMGNVRSPWAEAAGITGDTHLVTVPSQPVFATEGGTATVTVSVSPTATTGSVSVGYAVTGDGATPADDYTVPAAQSVEVAAGSPTALIEIPVVDDTVPEGAEAFVVSLTGVSLAGNDDSEARLGTGTETTVTIVPSDAIAVSLSAGRFVTPGSEATVTVSLWGVAPASDVAMSVTTGGTAPAADYTAPDTHTVPAADLSSRIVIPTEATATLGGEIEVTVSMPTGGTPGISLLLDVPSVTVTVAEPNLPPAYRDTSVTLMVAENSPESATVGTVAAVDSDPGAVLTYSLTGADSARFGIGEDTGEITVAAGAGLDHESGPTVSVTVWVGDGLDDIGRADPSVDASVLAVVEVTDVDEWPGAPANLSVTPVDRTELSLSWEAPDTSGIPPVTGYDVGYREAVPGATEDDYVAVTHSGTDTAASIPGLTPGSLYDIRVRARNDEDTALDGTVRSPWANVSGNADNNPPVFGSPSATLTVGESAAPGAAVGDALTATDPDPGDVLGYSLSGADASLFGVDPGSGQVTVGAGASLDRAADPSHEVELVATDPYTAAATLSVEIVVGSVPAAPAVPSVVAAPPDSHTDLEVSWEAPDDNALAIEGYELRRKEQGAEDAAYVVVAHASTDTTATISGLTPLSDYEVQVRALNAEGAGPWSGTGSGSTDPALDLDVDESGDVDHQDALLIFYSWRFGNFLRANVPLLNLVYGRIQAQTGSTIQPIEVLGNAEAELTAPGISGIDVDESGDVDHQDALLIFYSWRFGNFLRANVPLLNLVYGRIQAQTGSTIQPIEVLENAEAVLTLPGVNAPDPVAP